MNSTKDNRIFQIKKLNYVEENVFKYFFPYCLINCPLGVIFMLKKYTKPKLLFLICISCM